MERDSRHLCQYLTVEPVKDPQGTALGDPADHRRGHLPAFANGQHTIESLGLDDGQHPLLGLAGHDLVGLHTGLAPRHGRHVDVHTHAATRRRLTGGARQSGTS